METYEIDYNGNYIILSDIHGNYAALCSSVNDALETYGKTIKGFIFLGDYVCDYPNGKQVVELMMKLKEKYPCYIISGNRETGMVKHYYDKTKGVNQENITLEEAEQLTGWSLDTSMGCPLVDCYELTKEQLAFLSSLPETIVLKNQRQTILLKHKMPLTDEEMTFLEQEANQIIETEYQPVKRESIILTGHTHDVNVSNYNHIKHFNPGAVALGDTGNPGTYYGVLNHGKLINKHIEYDYQRALDELSAKPILFERCAGWGEVLKASIITGVNCTVLYANENKRLIEEFKQLDQDTAMKFLSLGEEEAIELGKMLFPILKLEEKPFSQGRYGNTNAYGDYLERTIFESSTETTHISARQIITDDIDPKPKREAKNNAPVPTKILSIIATEYTNEYLKYTQKGEYYVNISRWK